MEQNLKQGKAWRNFVRRLCFAAMGISAFANPLEVFSPYYLVFGALIGLFFGWVFRKFLRGFLGIFNGKFKKEKGKEAIRYVVDNGMLFLAPFAVMMVLAVYYFNWSETRAFVASGIMAVGTAAALELGKMKGKQEIRNTLATSGVSLAFSFLWTLSYVYLAKAPALLEGGVNLVGAFLAGGGVGL